MLNPLIDTESIPVSSEPVSQVPGRVLPYRYFSSAATTQQFTTSFCPIASTQDGEVKIKANPLE